MTATTIRNIDDLDARPKRFFLAPRKHGAHVSHSLATSAITGLLLIGCSGASTSGAAHPLTGSTTSSSPDSPSSTASPSTSPPASSICSLYSTDDVARLLQSGTLTQVPTPSGCLWFAKDQNINVALAVNFYSTPGEAHATFQSQQQFDPTAKPFNFGDRAYSAVLTPRHA